MTMPKKPKNSQPFDQQKYVQEWSKQNMTFVSARYKNEFVQEFKEACKALGITQSEVIRSAMQATIDKYTEKFLKINKKI